MMETRSIRGKRRMALLHDTLLFCGAFTAGAIVFTIVHWFADLFGDGKNYWEIGLSDGLILTGLIFGELFILWNNGIRQGLRGHSIGKHRVGLRVVDVGTGSPTGALRGAVRGLVMAVLLDLSVAAIPIGLPTVLRRLTPESWHFGGAAYLALLVLVIPIVLQSRRGLADLIARTKVVEATGDGAGIAPRRRQVLELLDVLGVVGVVAVAANYVVFYWPLFFHFPHLF